MSPTELKSLVSGEGLGANHRPLSSEFEVRLPPKESSMSGVGAVSSALERDITFKKKTVGAGGEGGGSDGTKMSDFGLSLRRASLRASGSGRETEAVLVDREELDRDFEEVLVGPSSLCRGGEVLLEVNGTSVAGMGRDEVDRALAEMPGDEIRIRVSAYLGSLCLLSFV